MSSTDRALVGWFKDAIAGLKSSYLVMFLAALFAVDLAFLDPLPFLDEAVLFTVTLLLARWKGAKQQRIEAAPSASESPKPPPKDVTPPAAE